MNVDYQLSDVYIERCEKETEQVVAKEEAAFLKEPIDFFKKHKNEFIYIESPSFEAIGVDAVSFEVDDVFGTYDVMLGLKLPKKLESVIKEYLHNHLNGNDAKFDLMFNPQDGLWDLNFTLNYAEGFNEDMSLGEAFEIVLRLLNQLVESVKN